MGLKPLVIALPLNRKVATDQRPFAGPEAPLGASPSGSFGPLVLLKRRSTKLAGWWRQKGADRTRLRRPPYKRALLTPAVTFSRWRGRTGAAALAELSCRRVQRFEGEKQLRQLFGVPEAIDVQRPASDACVHVTPAVGTLANQ